MLNPPQKSSVCPFSTIFDETVKLIYEKWSAASGIKQTLFAE